MGNRSPKESWTVLYVNISARLKYPVPTCTLLEKVCKSIIFPVIRATLPRSGITSNIATKIREVSHSWGGAGVLSYLVPLSGNILSRYDSRTFE